MSICEVYKAMGDESRLRLLHILSQGQFNVQELTSILHLSQSTVSHHLKALLQAGFAATKKEGTWVYYRLAESDALPSQVTQGFLQYLHSNPADTFHAILTKDKSNLADVLHLRRIKAKDYFETVAKEWDTVRDQAQGSESYIDTLHSHIPSSDTLLELGCGSGAVLKQLLPREGTTIGVDYSEAMIEEAKRNLEGSQPQTDLRLGSLEHLPLGDNTVDTALAYMVFHHVAEPSAALQDAARVIRPGGKLVIIDLLEHENDRMREQYADLWLGFCPKQFAVWVKQAGFDTVSTEVLGEHNDVFLLTASAKS